MKNLKNVLACLFALSLASCGTIKIKDQVYCGDAGPLGATCFHTRNDETFDLDVQEWEENRYGMICTEASNYSDNIAIIQKACRACKCCTYDAKKQIFQFKEKIIMFRNQTNKSLQELF